MSLHLVSNTASQTSRVRESGAVVLVTRRSDTLFQALARAIETYVPGVHVLLVKTIEDVTPRDGRVELILLAPQDVDDEAALSELVRACRERYSSPALAVMIPEMRESLNACKALFQARLVQGLLPVTLKLDVWLAAMSLLLSGGEFYPFLHATETEDPAPRRSWQDSDAAQREDRPYEAQNNSRNTMTASGDIEVLNLTAREAEIMELVSQGYQNKVIADFMDLSQHTVKVHVHNIITKLRVTNRTQAVAAMWAARDGTSRLGTSRPALPSSPEAAAIVHGGGE